MVYESSQSKVNVTYLNMFIRDEQEIAVMEDWEEARDGGMEKLIEWAEEWMPTLTSPEAARVSDLIQTMSESSQGTNGICSDEDVRRCKEAEDELEKFVRPHVKDFRNWLQEAMGDLLGYKTFKDCDLEESQW